MQKYIIISNLYAFSYKTCEVLTFYMNINIVFQIILNSAAF